MTQSKAEMEKQARVERDKAGRFMLQKCVHMGDAIDAGLVQDWLVQYAAQVREQSIAECCKAMCIECNGDDEPERFSNGYWYHTMLGFDDRTEECRASSIRRRLAAPPSTSQGQGDI